jgi:hypothetical protein
MAATTIPGFRGQSGMSVLCVVALSAAVAGCVQSSATKRAQPKPEIAAVAPNAPVVLSGVAYTDGNLATPPAPNAPASPPAISDIVPVPPGGAPAPDVASSPVPPPAPALFAAPVIPPTPETPPSETPPPETPPVAATTADGFPNINVAPKQPGGQLLTPEERAKLIAELNALAGRKTGTQ